MTRNSSVHVSLPGLTIARSFGKMHVACNRSNLHVEQSTVPRGNLQRNRYNTKCSRLLDFSQLCRDDSKLERTC